MNQFTIPGEDGCEACRYDFDGDNDIDDDDNKLCQIIALVKEVQPDTDVDAKLHEAIHGADIGLAVEFEEIDDLQHDDDLTMNLLSVYPVEGNEETFLQGAA